MARSLDRRSFLRRFVGTAVIGCYGYPLVLRLVLYVNVLRVGYVDSFPNNSLLAAPLNLPFLGGGVALLVVDDLLLDAAQGL